MTDDDPLRYTSRYINDSGPWGQNEHDHHYFVTLIQTRTNRFKESLWEIHRQEPLRSSGWRQISKLILEGRKWLIDVRIWPTQPGFPCVKVLRWSSYYDNNTVVSLHVFVGIYSWNVSILSWVYCITWNASPRISSVCKGAIYTVNSCTTLVPKTNTRGYVCMVEAVCDYDYTRNPKGR